MTVVNRWDEKAGLRTNIRRIADARQSNSQSYYFTQPNWSWLDVGAIAGTSSSLDPSAPQFSSLGFPAVAPGFKTSYDQAVTSLAGILPQVVAVYNQTKTLSVLPQGSYVPRHFRATEAEWYAQDSWRATRNLTLTFGARYALLQPSYETTGTQVAPTFSLDDFFKKRGQAMLNGQSYAPLITFNLAGQANGKQPLLGMGLRKYRTEVCLRLVTQRHGWFLEETMGRDR